MENNQQLLTTSQQTTQKDKVFSNVDLNNQFKGFNVKIIGLGGAGCNVINHISKNHKNIMENAKVYAFNTDLCSLKLVEGVSNLFLLNKDELKGYGSGCNPEIGKKAIEHDATTIKQELTNTDILIIVTGLGKGTGSGGVIELAKIAKELGILTISIVNMPSVACEGSAVYNNAFNALQALLNYCDSITTISNERIIGNNKDISFYNAYELANEEISLIIEDIVNIIFKPSQMNIDFSDLRSFFLQNKFFMSNRITIDSVGISQLNIKEALSNKIKKSFVDVDISECKEVIVNISISKDTPTTFMAELNRTFIELTHNDKLSFVVGINYNNEQKIYLSFLMAGKNHSTDFKNAFEANTSSLDSLINPTIKLEAVDDSSANEYDNLMKNVDEAAKDTADILKEDK